MAKHYERLFPTGEELKGWLPGLIVCMIFAWLMVNLSGFVGDYFSDDFFLNKYHLNSSVLYLLIIGIVIRNTVGITSSMQNGVNISRGIIKPGIVLLGAHYMWGDVIEAGGPALLLVILFVMGTAVSIMLLGKKFGVPDGLAGIMGAGVGICGVSAIVATTPVVRSRPRDMFYAIATILLFGALLLFALPATAAMMGLPSPQAGAWSATAILNTAQLTAAAQMYDQMAVGNNVEQWGEQAALLSATIVNIARVIFIPIIVLFAIWFYIIRPTGGGEEAEKVDVWGVVRDKFPVFVLGFFAIVLLNSIGVFGEHELGERSPWADLLGDTLMDWFFAVGFAGIGLNISLSAMKKAGGTALVIGIAAALTKAVLSLIVILAIGPEAFHIVT